MQRTPTLKRIEGSKTTFIKIPAKKYADNIFFCVLFISKLNKHPNPIPINYPAG